MVEDVVVVVTHIDMCGSQADKIGLYRRDLDMIVAQNAHPVR